MVAALMRCNFSRTVSSTVISPNFSSSGSWCRSTPISRLPHMPPYRYQIFSSASYTCWSYTRGTVRRARRCPTTILTS